MSDPVVVYLDSQDFSRFSPSHPDYKACLPVRQELFDLKQSGSARYVFSDVHIFEALPTSPSHSKPALERIRAIAEFCGTDHLPSSITLVEHELRQLTGQNQVPIWPEWYPHFDMEEPDRKRIMGELISEMATNRRQRRQLAKAMNAPSDSRLDRVFVDEFLSKYPFLREGRGTLQSYLSREASWDAVTELLKTSMRDIVGLAEWLIANWKHGRAFVESLRNGNRRVQSALSDMYTNMRVTFEHSSMTAQEHTQIVKEVYEEQREKYFDDFAGKLAANITGAPADVGVSAPADRRRAPSLFAAIDFMMDVAYLSALPEMPRNPRKHAGSDFADALHVLFLPRVDIFRADQFSCSVLQAEKFKDTAHICSALSELPKLIKMVTYARE